MAEIACITGDEVPFPPGELARLKTRRWILKHIKQHSVGMEVGVFRGHFSEIMAEDLKPKKLYLIDPWTTLGEKFNWSNEASPYLGGGC